MEIQKLEFHKRNNATGKLTFLESGKDKDIPFNIRRIYYVYDVAPGERRGFHAHKKLEQYLICIHGSCTIYWMMEVSRRIFCSTTLVSGYTSGRVCGEKCTISLLEQFCWYWLRNIMTRTIILEIIKPSRLIYRRKRNEDSVC